jgi:hypothetical protein
MSGAASLTRAASRTRAVSPMRAGLLSLAALLALSGCGPESPEQALDRQARSYVRIAMDLDRQVDGEVDGWFGPERLDARDEPPGPAVNALLDDARAARDELASAGEPPAPRGPRLGRRIDELLAVLEFHAAETPPAFREEAEALYGIRWREEDVEGLQALRDELDRVLPGRGSLRVRIAGLRRQLVVPAERRLEVFERALEACRERTLAHWDLPEGEQLEVIPTRDVDAAWHQYHGAYRSTLRVNDLALGTIDRAIDVACHEGYPGHHAQFVLFEAAAGSGGLPLEDRLVLLRSPASAFREGAAQYAVDLAFPPSERLAFERDVLFPLAGLDPALAETLAAVRPLLARLEAVVPHVIRAHEDGELSDQEAILRLRNEALVASPRQLFAFAHEVRAYVAGYTMVRQALEERLPPQSPEAWSRFARWLERPERWFEGD